MSVSWIRGTIVVMVVGLGVVVLGVACGQDSGVLPTESPESTATLAQPATPPQPTATSTQPTTPPQPTPTPPLFAPTVAGWPHTSPSHGDEYPEPPFHYAANPSVNEQMHRADAIVRATLISDTNGMLKFRVAEYLKGSGPSEITIRAKSGRDRSYDDREAILFLAAPAGATGSGGTDSSRFDFVVGTTERYRGGFPSGHSINRQDRAWMPAVGTGGATGSGGTPAFDPGAPAPGRMHEEPWTVEQIKESIAWMTAEDDDAYRSCVGFAIWNEQYYRMKAAYYGELYRPDAEEEIESGLPAGTVIWAATLNTGPQYGTYWVEGEDASLFNYVAWDDDENPEYFYETRFVHVRPLPAGTYKVTTRGIRGDFIACNYTPESGGRLDWTVRVTAPVGVLHETFFDPVTLTSGVGVMSGVGEFSVGGQSVAITGLRWDDGAVVMSMSPYVSLDGHRLEFIDMDGAIGLRLDVDDAQEDGVAGTYTWMVAEQPWEEGDLLMLRVR